MKYVFFQKNLRKYLVTGIIMNAVVFLGLVLVSYRESLEKTRMSFARVLINRVKMEETIKSMDQAMDTISRMVPQINSLNRRDALLIATDDLKVTMKDSEIILQDIRQEASELILPVEIDMDAVQFGNILQALGHLRSLRFPYAEISELRIEKQGQAAVSRVRCLMKILLKMPADFLQEEEAGTEQGAPPPPPPGTDPA